MLNPWRHFRLSHTAIKRIAEPRCSIGHQWLYHEIYGDIPTTPQIFRLREREICAARYGNYHCAIDAGVRAFCRNIDTVTVLNRYTYPLARWCESVHARCQIKTSAAELRCPRCPGCRLNGLHHFSVTAVGGRIREKHLRGEHDHGRGQGARAYKRPLHDAATAGSHTNRPRPARSSRRPPPYIVYNHNCVLEVFLATNLR